jgi:carbon monoxide dehydrogenase subunit G
MLMRALYAIACGSMLALVGCSLQSHVAEPAAVAASKQRERELTPAEWARLRAGERIERPRAFVAGRSDYIGGMSHQLVDAEPDQILQALLDPNRLQRMLPQTRRIAQVGSGYPAPGLELEQGNDIISATYSVLLDHDLPAREVRFRLDRSRPSDIDDVEGFFRVVPAGDGRSLITVAAALDVGSGLVRLLFADIIQSLILATPSQIKDVVEASADSQAAPQLAHAAR